MPPKWQSTWAVRPATSVGSNGSRSPIIRTSANAFRSTLSGFRPAPFTASTSLAIIDWRAATISRRSRFAPSSVSASPSEA